MSYNIDHIVVLRGELSIRAADARKLKKEADNNAPEDSFIEDLIEALDADEVPQWLEIKMRWRGEGSGRSWDYFTNNVVPLLRGSADLVMIWEGGDSITGLRIQDGQATEMNVQHTLVSANESVSKEDG